MITRITVFLLAFIAAFVYCAPGGNKKSQILEQEVLSLKENLTALWELVGQMRLQLDRLEPEEPRVHHHHHHYHHRYYPVANNDSLDDVNGTIEWEEDTNSPCLHDITFEQLMLPPGVHHKHHHQIHHHHPKDINYTEQNGNQKCNGNHNGLNSNGAPDEDDGEEVIAKAVCDVRPNRALSKNERQHIRGSVHFRQKATHLTIHMNLKGFLTTAAIHPPPEDESLVNNVNTHGVLVHEFADLSNGCESAGDPQMTDDADDANKKPIGSIGNIQCDSQGNLITTIADYHTSLIGTYSIIGKTLVIHENPILEDFFTEQNPNPMNGNQMGRRLACCVIK